VQQTSDPPVIGVLAPLSLSALPEIWTPLGSGLQDIGYFEGRNYTLEFWFADGMVERLPEVPQRRSVSLFHPRFLQKLMK